MCSVCVCVWVHFDCGCQNVSFMNASYVPGDSNTAQTHTRLESSHKRRLLSLSIYTHSLTLNCSQPICLGRLKCRINTHTTQVTTQKTRFLPLYIYTFSTHSLTLKCRTKDAFSPSLYIHILSPQNAARAHTQPE